VLPELKALGVAGILMKPFKPEALLAAILGVVKLQPRPAAAGSPV